MQNVNCVFTNFEDFADTDFNPALSENGSLANVFILQPANNGLKDEAFKVCFGPIMQGISANSRETVNTKYFREIANKSICFRAEFTHRHPSSERNSTTLLVQAIS